MKIEMQEIEPCVKKISIEVPVERIDEEKSAAYRDLAKTATVPGFRKGRAPRGILEKMFSKSVMSDITQRLIESAYREAVETKNLKPVGQPMVDNIVAEDSQPLSFTATVEVFPEVEVKEVSEISLTRKLATVDDAEIDKVLEHYRERQAWFEPVEDRGAQEGDNAMINYSACKEDGSELERFKGENSEVRISENEMFKGFFDGIVGMKKGEEKEFEAVFPKELPDPELADTKARFKVKVNEIKQKVLPKIDDQLAKEVSEFDTLEELKTDIKTQLEKRNSDNASHALREELLTKLIEDNPFDVSPGMVERQAKSLAEQSEQRLKSQGIDMGQAGVDSNILMERSRDDAVRMIKEQALLTSFATASNIKVGDEDVDKELEKLAKMLNQPVDATRAQLTESKGLDGVIHQAFIEKTYEAIMEKITIKDEVVEVTDEK